MVLWFWAFLLAAEGTHSMVCAILDYGDRNWFGFWAQLLWALALFAGAGCVGAVAWN